jgi:hypothetical protein
MNRTLKEATIKRFHYGMHHNVRAHLKIFLDAYNVAKRLKALKGRAVFECIAEKWTSEPKRLRLRPNHLSPGLNR